MRETIIRMNVSNATKRESVFISPEKSPIFSAKNVFGQIIGMQEKLGVTLTLPRPLLKIFHSSSKRHRGLL